MHQKVLLLFLEVFIKNVSCINMNWNEWNICKEKAEEELRCPKNRKYSDALKKSLNLKCLAIWLDLPLAELSAQILFDKNSSWHHTCHQKFTKNLLERAKPKRKKDENDGQS